MLYLANPSTPRVRRAMAAGYLGAMMTPGQGNRLPDDALWGGDNGVYGGKYPGNPKYLRWLQRVLEQSSNALERCLFAAAPDVLHRREDGTVYGDAAATLERSAPMLPAIRALGIPAALVAQDGLEQLTVPWDEFDVLFVGGSTEFKLSAQAGDLVREARARGKHTHLGRLSSFKRWSHADYRRYRTVDGTFIKYGPDIRLPQVLGWGAQTALFDEDTDRGVSIPRQRAEQIDLFGEATKA